MQYPVRRRSPQRQRGMGLLAVLFLLAVAGFLLATGMALAPHYMEFYTVKSVMDDLAKDSTTVDGGKTGIVKTIQNQLYINSIKDVGPKAFRYKKARGGYQVSLDYQVQEHLVANVDVILTFNHEVVVTAP